MYVCMYVCVHPPTHARTLMRVVCDTWRRGVRLTHTHTHTRIHACFHSCVCVCVCVRVPGLLESRVEAASVPPLPWIHQRQPYTTGRRQSRTAHTHTHTHMVTHQHGEVRVCVRRVRAHEGGSRDGWMRAHIARRNEQRSTMRTHTHTHTHSRSMRNAPWQRICGHQDAIICVYERTYVCACVWALHTRTSTRSQQGTQTSVMGYACITNG